jgi:hypothetical protein
MLLLAVNRFKGPPTPTEWHAARCQHLAIWAHPIRLSIRNGMISRLQPALPALPQTRILPYLLIKLHILFRAVLSGRCSGLNVSVPIPCIRQNRFLRVSRRTYYGSVSVFSLRPADEHSRRTSVVYRRNRCRLQGPSEEPDIISCSSRIQHLFSMYPTPVKRLPATRLLPDFYQTSIPSFAKNPQRSIPNVPVLQPCLYFLSKSTPSKRMRIGFTLNP